MLNKYACPQRDFVHVDDVALVRSEFASVVGLPWYKNLGTGEATCFAEVVDACMHHFFGLKIEHRESLESEYSGADADLLRQHSSNRYQSVLDFVHGMTETPSLTRTEPMLS